MKRLTVCSITLLVLLFSITRCKLDSNNYIKTSVFLSVLGWNLPDSSKVSTPFELKLRSCAENSCTYNFCFYVDQYDASTFRVLAKGVYESHGETCSVVSTFIDSTKTITINQAGKYYFYFLKNDFWEKDSIIIVP